MDEDAFAVEDADVGDAAFFERVEEDEIAFSKLGLLDGNAQAVLVHRHARQLVADGLAVHLAREGRAVDTVLVGPAEQVARAQPLADRAGEDVLPAGVGVALAVFRGRRRLDQRGLCRLRFRRLGRRPLLRRLARLRAAVSAGAGGAGLGSGGTTGAFSPPSPASFQKPTVISVKSKSKRPTFFKPPEPVHELLRGFFQRPSGNSV